MTVRWYLMVMVVMIDDVDVVGDDDVDGNDDVDSCPLCRLR